MAIIEETDKSKRGERERWIAPEISKAVLTPKIINSERGRKALEKRALRGRAESCEVDKEHSFARGFTLRLVGTFANDGDALRVAAGPLRRTHWFVAALIKLIADTFVCDRPRECAAERRF